MKNTIAEGLRRTDATTSTAPRSKTFYTQSPSHPSSLQPPPLLLQQKKQKFQTTHRKNHHHLTLPLNDSAQIEADLEAAEGLVDEEVADLGGGDEARGGGEEVGGREGRGLDAEGAEDEEGFFCIFEGRGV